MLLGEGTKCCVAACPEGYLVDSGALVNAHVGSFLKFLKSTPNGPELEADPSPGWIDNGGSRSGVRAEAVLDAMVKRYATVLKDEGELDSLVDDAHNVILD
jgi:hypothetical protein